MSRKMVLIGGGSYGWTPKVATDLMMEEGLENSELVLVDINPDAAQLLCDYCNILAKKMGTGWTVRTSDLEPALDGADVVFISITTGGFDAMHHDYTLPEDYGVFHAVGDTVGPGGSSRTLRNVPVFVDIAKKMEKICPDTWLIHVTNPLGQLTAAVDRATSIKCVGLCHNFLGTRAFLANFLEVERTDIEAVSVGVNHGSWMKDLKVKGQPVDPEKMTLKNYLRYEAAKLDDFKEGMTDEEIEGQFPPGESLSRYLSFTLYEQLGLFPVGGAPHVAENLPFYLNSNQTAQKYRIKRKGVLPGRQKGNEKKRQTIIDRIEGKEEWPTPERSIEAVASIVHSLFTGKESRVMVTMPNRGQISNLPENTPVETWAAVDENGVVPENAGGVPPEVLGLVQGTVAEINLSIDAALTGDRKKFEQAVYLSPMLHRKDCARELSERLLAVHADMLPQFKTK